MILAGSASLCMVDAFDGNNYINEPRDVSLQVQQQPFNFEHLQRLRSKFQEDAHSRNENINNNGKNDNTRNTFLAVVDPMSKDQSNSGDQTSYQTNNQPKFNEMEFFDEFESNLPYGIQNVRRDLTSRSSRSQKRLHKPKTTFQSLCPSKRLVIPLETIAYEYRPDHYEEVTCFHSYAPARDYLSETNKVCSEAGFTCIQLNRTVYLTRRAKGSECWESETRIVPSGCECMWPKHTFGDIITYH